MVRNVLHIKTIVQSNSVFLFIFKILKNKNFEKERLTNVLKFVVKIYVTDASIYEKYS